MQQQKVAVAVPWSDVAGCRPGHPRICASALHLILVLWPSTLEVVRITAWFGMWGSKTGNLIRVLENLDRVQ